jgi:hypothetical protein
MKGHCEFGYKGKHETYIEGTPRSAMTWRVCSLCGQREERGPGLFYGRPEPKPTLTDSERITELERKIEHFAKFLTGENK